MTDSTPARTGAPSAAQPLFILAMDHRDSFGRTLFGAHGTPTDEQLAGMRSSKELIFAAFARWQGSTAGPGQLGILVEEQLGAEVARQAREVGIRSGVLIYWTVDTTGAMAIYSQHLTCSASEVHAMVEGVMRHKTNMNVETNYVDSHRALIIGSGVTRLLNFDLVARFKQINVMKLYLPGRTDRFSYPLLRPALTRPIRPDIIANNYDLMIKYVTAIRQGTAFTEALLRRFQGETTHPAYSAMLEVGCAQRT